MSSRTTEAPFPAAGLKSRASADHLEAEAIGLEVPVRIHGSQVTAVVLDTTEHAEPFEEDTTTMIVFPRGSVVKLRAHVRTGHAIVLTNLLTRQEVLCRIIQVNSAANVVYYVKLEFVQQAPGFWGVHFPSDPLPSRNTQATSAAIPATPATNEGQASLPIVGSRPGDEIPLSSSVRPITNRAPSLDPSRGAPPTQNKISGTATKYGPTRVSQQEDLEPLATAPPKLADPPGFLSAHPNPQKHSLPESRRDLPSSIARKSISSVPVLSDAETDSVKPKRQGPALVPSQPRNEIALDDASVRLEAFSDLKPGLADSKSSRKNSKWALALAMVSILAISTAGGFYFLRRWASAAQVPLAAQTPVYSQTPSQTGSTASIDPAPNAPTISAGPTGAPDAQSEITVTAATDHVENAVAPSQTKSPQANRFSHIFAGDMNTKPQITPRSVTPIETPLPQIQEDAATSIAKSSPAAVLGSLVSEPSRSALPAPPPVKKPAPATREGGLSVPPRLITSVAPIYPPLAKTNNVEGEVKIQAQINKMGEVTGVKVLSGPILLRNAAINAVRRWKYSPATLDGQPVVTEYLVTIRFRLTNH
jgi:TonB family protein